jgi:hypothetical protein
LIPEDCTLGADASRTHAGAHLFALLVEFHKALRQTRGAATNMAFLRDLGGM